MKNSIIENINLGSFKVSLNGRNFEFELLDMSLGDYYGTLKCENVYYFEYQNIFENDDGFACYLCEIYSFNLEHSVAVSQLKEKNFRFSNQNHEIFIPDYNIQNVVLESGEVFIDLYCEAYRLEL